MIPEKLPQNISSTSSRVSLRQAKKDQEPSPATSSTTKQLSQVSLKMPKDRINSKLQQANAKLDQRIAEEQERAGKLFNTSDSEQLALARHAVETQQEM